MHRVERLSIREISRRTGLHRRTIRRALASDVPPRYVRLPAVSKLDPFREWEPLISSVARESSRNPARAVRTWLRHRSCCVALGAGIGVVCPQKMLVPADPERALLPPGVGRRGVRRGDQLGPDERVADLTVDAWSLGRVARA
jgi:hypothetical protein